MGEYSSVEELAASLVHDAELGASVIGVDGNDGSGKSVLATSLVARLQWSFISLDDFLHKNLDAYVANLDYEALSRVVSSVSRPLIIEGVCLLEVSERLELKLDRLIYVKRLGPGGLWTDGEECDFDCSPEDVIAKIEENIKGMEEFLACVESKTGDSDEESSGLTRFRVEVIHYHSRYKPLRVADYVFAWHVNDT